MSKAAMNLQDSFLNQVRRENSEVRVLLVNGTLLRGTVKGFDNFTLILNNRNGQHLIYKHAVAQIVTHRPHLKSDESASPEESASSTDEAVAPQEQAHAAADEKPTNAQDKPVRFDKSGRQDSPQHDHAHKQKSKKEGFNTLDLSRVKLGEKS